jgi:ankyrin repeat protein
MAYHLLSKLHKSNAKLIQFFNIPYNPSKHTIQNIMGKKYYTEKQFMNILEFLVSKNICLKYAYVLLERACSLGYLLAVKFLMANDGPSVDLTKNTLLYRAAFGGHIDIIEFLLGKGFVLNIHTQSNPLTVACKKGHLNIVMYLLGLGIPLQSHNNIALATASKQGHIAVVRYLVERGALDGGDGTLALEWASAHNRPKIVQYLLEQGVDVNGNYSAALIAAARKGRLSIVKHLVTHGANFKTKGNGVVMSACRGGHLEVIRYLNVVGADIKGFKNECVDAAVSHNHLKLVQYLVEHGAVIPDCNKAVRVAVSKNYFKLTQYLVEKGADITSNKHEAFLTAARKGFLTILQYIDEVVCVKNRPSSSVYNCALQSVCFDCDHLVIAEYLVSKGAIIEGTAREQLGRYCTLPFVKLLVDNNLVDNTDLLNATAGGGQLDKVKYIWEHVSFSDDEKFNALTFAVKNHRLEVIQFLVEAGVDYRRNDDFIFRRACKCMCPIEILKYLFDKGVNIHASEDEALRSAVSNNRVQHVKYLVSVGANLRAHNDASWTIAVFNNSRGIIKYMVEECGFDVNALDNYAVIVASGADNYQMVKYLVDHGADCRVDNDKPFRLACLASRMQTILYLLSQGADVSAADNEALKNAVDSKNVQLTKFLVARGAGITDEVLNKCRHRPLLDFFLEQRGASISSIISPESECVIC